MSLMSASGAKRKRADSDGGPETKRYSARRKAACQSCRLRKVKCDQERPTCSLCQLSGLRCVFFDDTEDGPKLDPASRVIAGRLDEVLASVRNIEARVQHSGPFSNEHEGANLRESTKDYLKIPWGRTSADTVLTWPIFQKLFRPDHLIGHFFQTPSVNPASGIFGSSLGSQAEVSSLDYYQVPGGLSTLPDDRIPLLVDRFLQNVHTKNPILDVDALVFASRKVAATGLKWDAESCLVLLACALGSISYPFVKALASVPGLGSTGRAQSLNSGSPNSSSISQHGGDLKVGESYFTLACRRLGLLRFTTLGAQCHFFAGVYLMYTFRPLEAWNSFNQASTYFQFFLKSAGGTSSEEQLAQDIDRLQRISRLQRRLEQSLYWSCFKSEVEMRVELPLVQSPISNFEYPDLFPCPPTPTPDEIEPKVVIPPSLRQAVDATYSSSIRDLRSEDSSRPLTEDLQELRQHRRELYNEEESWYYYLTEVALRRISNRIINTFYRGPRDAWLQINQWIPIALEFDDQISTWSANLPASMQSLERASARGRSTVASPTRASKNKSRTPNPTEVSVAKEMSWCIENRLLEMRSWLYQPFLYYAIHHGWKLNTDNTAAGGSKSDQEEALRRLVQSGIDCNVKILEWRSLPHRHHGIWFDLRAVVTASIVLNAVARTANLTVPSHLFEEGTSRDEAVDGMTFAIVFQRLRFWEDEAPDIKKATVLLKEMVSETKALLETRGTQR